MVIAHASQGGLGLPDRDYYTKDDEASKKLRDALSRACHQDLTPARRIRRGRGQAREDRHGDRDFAGQAGAHPRRAARSAEELQQDDAAELQKLMPDCKWDDYFKNAQRRPRPQPSMSASRSSSRPPMTVFKTASLDDWKTYLRWHLIHDTAPALSKTLSMRISTSISKRPDRGRRSSNRAGNAS